MPHSALTHLRVSGELAIPRSELQFRASRAGGAGGQHVNTSSTRIELTWDLARSAAVSEAQRDRLLTKLRARTSADGVLRIVASERRSQAQNRLAAEKRLADVVRHALVVPKQRRATKPPRSAKEQRLTDKRRRAKRKRDRRGDLPE